MGARLIRIKLYHHGCWTTRLDYLRGEGIKVAPINRYVTDSGTTTYVMMRGSVDRIKRILFSRFGNHRPKIMGYMGRGRARIYVVSLSFEPPSNSVARIIMSSGLIPLNVSYEGECEIWDLLGSSRYFIRHGSNIIDNLRAVSDVEGLIMRDTAPIPYSHRYMALTDTELRILRKLGELGYFDSPREVSIDDAAKVIGVSKGYISRVLRNALKKIIE